VSRAGRAGPGSGVTFEARLPAPWGAASFRPLQVQADLDLVHGWMRAPHVAPWWELDVPRAELAAYLERAVADDHQQVLIGSVGGRPVSYWEVYWAARDPLAAWYQADPHDQGVHLLIGPRSLTGRGLGTALLGAVAAWQLGREPATRRVVAEPDVRNIASLRAFERGGFRRVAELDLPSKHAALMVRERAAAAP
jgi:acetyl CoA:N6-hydroxylysine acetyl transferase